MELCIAHLQPRSTTGVLGPGARFGIWVQGCPRRCPGCFNPDFLDFGTPPHSQYVDTGNLICHILEEHHRAPLEGVTFTGGEPLSRARPLAEVAAAVQHHGLNVVVFTGMYSKELGIKGGESEGAAASPDLQRLLDHTDLIIAGPYIEAQRLERPDLRGSDNQQVLRLTDRIALPLDPPQVEVHLGDDGVVDLIGFPNQALRAQLAAQFERTLN